MKLFCKSFLDKSHEYKFALEKHCHANSCLLLLKQTTVWGDELWSNEKKCTY